MRQILIVEDDAKIANVVKVYLEGAGYQTLVAGGGRDALKAIEEERPLAVILDLMLPDISGEEVCQHIKDLGDMPVIMLTSKYTEEERVAGFALGADDYIVKPFSPRELVYRVKAVLRRTSGSEPMKPMGFNGGRLVIDERSFSVTRDGAPVKLTATEMKVLVVLAANPGRVLTREELVDKALGYQFEGYERSVDAHVKNIRRKIEPDPKSPIFIQSVYGVGYRFSSARDDKEPLG